MARYKLHWIDGKKEIIEGDNVRDAFGHAGYGHGALAALDYWETVEGKSLAEYVEAVNDAKHELDSFIMLRMVEVARENNIDEMIFTHLGNAYLWRGCETTCKELEELDEAYCANINEHGFEAVWRDGEGWV
jgi:hypothetical protein